MMEYESPEIIASYSEEELTSEASVSMQYGGGGFDWSWWWHR
jgi:hypothetical protein